MCSAVYELQGPDRQGNMKFFTKPWAMTTVMFLGMSFCLPWAYWEEHKHKKQAQEAVLSGNGGVTDPLLYGDSLVGTADFDTHCSRLGAACHCMKSSMYSKNEPHITLAGCSKLSCKTTCSSEPELQSHRVLSAEQ